MLKVSLVAPFVMAPSKVEVFTKCESQVAYHVISLFNERIKKLKLEIKNYNILVQEEEIIIEQTIKSRLNVKNC